MAFKHRINVQTSAGHKAGGARGTVLNHDVFIMRQAMSTAVPRAVLASAVQKDSAGVRRLGGEHSCEDMLHTR